MTLGSLPIMAGVITLSIACIAFCTPCPINRNPPSRNSTASCSPREIPVGTEAFTFAPSSKVISQEIVGNPREL